MKRRGRGSFQAQVIHKIPRQPLMVPQRFKMEPSDFAIGLTMSHDDEPSQCFASHPANIKSEPLVIDLTILNQEDGTAPVTTAHKHAHFAYSSTYLPCLPLHLWEISQIALMRMRLPGHPIFMLWISCIVSRNAKLHIVSKQVSNMLSSSASMYHSKVHFLQPPSLLGKCT